MLMRNIYSMVTPCIILLGVLVSGCKSKTIINEYRENPSVLMVEGDSIVVLGRRFHSNYETESDFIDCVGKSLQGNLKGINIIPEKSFIDSMYPYFETSTAPMDIENLDRLVQLPEISKKLNDYHVRYFIWIDGFTERTDSSGSISCSIGPGYGGCFGYASWDDEANYEATIWDFRELNLVGKVSAEAQGTSYMPAVIVPIPLLARVQSNACASMAEQIGHFLN